MKEPSEVEIPKTLYKYRCWGDIKHKRLITNSEIFMSSVRLFKDPFEYTLPISSNPPTKEEMYTKMGRIERYDNPNLSENEIGELINERYDKFMRENPDPNTLVRPDRYQDYLKDNFGVCSLSEDPTNFVTWSFYGESHRGFCVGFDSKKLTKFYEAFTDYLIFLEKVNYTRKGLTFGHLDFVNVNYVKFLTTKSKDWSYEQEWRLISCSTPDNPTADTTNIPLELEEGIIKEVIFGWDMMADHKREIQAIVQDGYLDASLFEIRKEESSLKLYLAPIRS